MGRRGNGVEYVDRNREERDGEKRNGEEYVDRNREERDGEKRKWGGICRQKQGGKRWGEEEMEWNT